jgi:hypothetical protein
MRTIGLPELLVILSGLTVLAMLVGFIVWAIVRGKRA